MDTVNVTHAITQRLMSYMDEDTIELCINEPGEIFIEKQGVAGMSRVDAPDLSRDYLMSVFRAVAGDNNESFSEKKPILTAIAPSGERIQVIMPPACVSRQFIVAVRRQVVRRIPFQSYVTGDYFSGTAVITDSDAYRREQQNKDPVFSAIERGEFEEGFRQAIALKRTIIVSGQMSSGKTALATSLMQYLDPRERIGTIEDSEELEFAIPNVVRLLANEDSDVYNGKRLVEACMRLRLDRVIVGELRGNLIEQFFRALMTSTKGSVTTLHADDPYTAIELMIDLYRSAVPNISPSDVRRIIHNTIDMIVFIGYDGQVRSGDAIYFPKYDSALIR